ncbi:MAG TPA: hypothetical protein VF255_09600 [Solirubrobacterales bacterium]
MSGEGRLSGRLLIAGSLLASVLLVGAFLAAGGSTYEPEQVQDPCEPREWSDPQNLGQLANQFTNSALDGAACELGVSREDLAQALATPEARERFKERYGIDDEKLTRAIRAGLLRAVDDAEEAGALSPFLAGPLRATLQRIPLDQLIEIVNDAEGLLGDVEGFLGPAREILEGFLP